MDFLLSEFKILDVKVQAALISAIIAFPTALIAPIIGHLFQKNFLVYKLNREYEHERQKEIKNLIGKMLGSLIDSGQNLNFRFFNIYENIYQKNKHSWLSYKGKYEDLRYYMESTAFRFMRFMYHAKVFEDQELYIDSRKAERKDQLFVYFIRSFFWVMADTALFKSIDYDYAENMDHFYADEMKAICASCERDDKFPDFEVFRREVINEEELRKVLVFFDGLKYEEDRYRWDRMVCFHLLLMSFLNAFGNEAQYSDRDVFEEVADKIKNKAVVDNLLAWLHKLGLGGFKELNNMQIALVNKRQCFETNLIKIC